MNKKLNKFNISWNGDSNGNLYLESDKLPSRSEVEHLGGSNRAFSASQINQMDLSMFDDFDIKDLDRLAGSLYKSSPEGLSFIPMWCDESYLVPQDASYRANLRIGAAAALWMLHN